MDNIAIFWDVENVTPSTDSYFVNVLLDYVSEMGKLSIATAFGDWTKNNLKKTSEILVDHSFEMIHIPKAKKNSADVTLITHDTEVLFLYPHIKKYIIVTGDADFRPLLLTLRKHGIEIIIICDAKSASEDLLVLADTYKDYRDLIPDEPDEKDQGEDREEIRMDLKTAADLVREAVATLVRNKRIPSLGAVKIRVKLLNESFDEKKLGYKTWKSFVLAISKKYGDLVLNQAENDQIIEIKNKDREEVLIPEIFLELVRTIKSIIENDRDKKPEAPFGLVAQKLKEKKIDIKEYGYNKLKKLIEAAEKRGLVSMSRQSAALTESGKKL
ncbi:MAG: NYN domain-containing protein [Spirochaetales bacterium]|nr:MAG: NYN domain-containing protein [Spirochaetales bacterium]